MMVSRQLNISTCYTKFMFSNQYIGGIPKWDTLSYSRQQSILKDYPNTERIADYIDEAKQHLTLEMADYTTRDFITDMVLITSAIALDFMCLPSSAYTTPVVATSSVRVMARLAPKLGSVAAGLGLEAQRLYKKADNFFKKKVNTETNKVRLKLEFGKSKYWDKLTTRKQSQHVNKISQRAKAEVRMDKDGFYYKFDKAHINQKIHLHKYCHIGGEKYQMSAEVNPETGVVTPKIGKVEIW